MGKTGNGVVLVMYALNDTGAFEVVNGLAPLLAVFGGENQLRLALAGDAVFGVAVDIAIGMTGNGSTIP